MIESLCRKAEGGAGQGGVSVMIGGGFDPDDPTTTATDVIDVFTL